MACLATRNKFIKLLLFSVAVFFTGCLPARVPAELPFTSGAVINSISSNASLSYKSADRSISGSCYFMLQKPDQIRVVILSPFGSVLQEVFISGEQITIIASGNGVALSGSFKDLPATGDFSAWRSIHWLTDIDPSDGTSTTAVIERINRFGEAEKASFKDGLIISKVTARAGQVRYGRYTTVQGVAVPLEIEYTTAAGELFSVLFEDPEINVPLLNDQFRPNVGKLPVYPLSNLK